MIHLYPWALPPSSGPSVIMLIVLMALVLAGSVYVYAHGNDASQWKAERDCCTESAFAYIPAWLLALYRLIAVAIGVWQLSGLFASGSEWAFCAYTIWNMSLLTAYFIVALVNYIFTHWKTRPNDQHDNVKHLLVPVNQQSSLRPREKAQLVLFAIELPAALLVTFVFWTILAPEILYSDSHRPNCTFSEALALNKTVINCTTYYDEEGLQSAEKSLVSVDNLVQHAINSAMMLLEMTFNKLRLRPLHAVFVGLWSLAYSAFAIFVWYPLTHLWVYPFLDTATMTIIPWQLGLLIGHWVFYSLCYCVIAAKFRWASGTREAYESVQQGFP